MEPIVVPVFGAEEAGLVLERFKWDPTPTASEVRLGLSTAEADGLVACADPDLTHAQKEWLCGLLLRNGDLFSVKLMPGQALAIPHKINTQGHWPIKCHPYWSSLKECEVLESKVERMHHASVM